MSPERFNGKSELDRIRARPAEAHNAIPEDRILDAARDSLLEHGMSRSTMADIAKRAQVSRATLYRRWDSVQSVIGALITREWAAIADAGYALGGAHARERVANAAVHITREIRAHPVQRKIIETEPEFLLPYQISRLGTSVAYLLARVEDAIRQGADDGSVRPGDPALQARTVLLAGWSFTVSAPAVVGAATGTGPEFDALDAELRRLIDRYLAP
ncbi:TetR/AcrR family transcriptional regulator [Actinomadura atramentaria]|uniref:TetR/AcrR family transcriptional regulator n=1 Tax=Actinomadura atramentaria TaxID=1990 RepID=UPI00035D555C|nr:TetR/AcrR family transcriptional regulator [Actinomadura atramentaria]